MCSKKNLSVKNLKDTKFHQQSDNSTGTVIVKILNMILLAILIIGLSLVLQLQLLCGSLYVWSCDTLLTNLDNVALHKVHLFSVFLVLDMC